MPTPCQREHRVISQGCITRRYARVTQDVTRLRTSNDLSEKTLRVWIVPKRRIVDMPVKVELEPGAVFDVNIVSGGAGGSSGGLTNTELRAAAVPVSLASVPSHAVTGPLTDAQLRAVAVPVSVASVPSHAVTGPITNTELRASAVPVSIASIPSHAVTGPLTNTEIRASPLPISGTVAISGTLPVSGTVTVNTGLTDAQLRATAVPVSGSVTANTGLAQPVTDAQIRATPLPVSGTVTATGPLTNTELRAQALPVSGTVTATGPATIAERRTLSATLWVTATGSVNTAVTCTLPAAGSGLFHYITSVELVKLYSVVGVASGAGVVCTSTNLPGSPSFTTEQLASPAGTAPKVISMYPAIPVRSAVANTATTFVAPAQLQSIWRFNVAYYTGP